MLKGFSFGENAYYVITPTSKTTKDQLDTMIQFAADQAAIPLVLDYKNHDYAVAAISHVPHVIASSLVNLVAQSDFPDGTMKKIAAGGFKDITRIASSSPVMWEQILFTNKDNIISLLEDYKRAIDQTITDLKTDNHKDIYDIFQPLMCDLEQEEFWALLLNQATKLIDKIRISSGGIDGTYADVRSILREALMQRATQIAVVHNHPSGNIQPSQPDRTLTEHIRKAADTMNIRLIDHVIVCEDGFYSFADEGLL